MSEYFRNLSRNGTTNVLDFYILFKNSLNQSEATELSTLLSFNLPSKPRSALFGTCSQCVFMATWPLAWDWGPWWPEIAFCESYEPLGSLGSLCKSFKGLSNDSQWSFVFLLFLYSGCPHVLTFCRDAQITSQLLRISRRHIRASTSPQSWISNNILFMGICEESTEIWLKWLGKLCGQFFDLLFSNFIS